ncbi:hypothetical protein F4809DRAFT_607103, partial [Biscogniauxia mediterranea]
MSTLHLRLRLRLRLSCELTALRRTRASGFVRFTSLPRPTQQPPRIEHAENSRRHQKRGFVSQHREEASYVWPDFSAI